MSTILGGRRGKAWAPELRELLTIDAIRPAADLKRKRDSGVADVGSDAEQGASKSPRLELADDEGTFNVPEDGLGDRSAAAEETVLEIPGDDDQGLEDSGMPAFDEAADDDAKRRNTSVVFQDLLPEKRTSKADATKMFFECLVLATKDAIKVEQKEGSLGDPIRIRGKRGLWGAWAEREAGGEIADQEDTEDQPQSHPEPPIAGPSRTVSAAA